VGPDLKPLANVTLHAAVRRDPLLEVSTERIESGEEIDARELQGIGTLGAGETFLAFRSYDPEHAATLVVTKHEYEPVAEVVVSHMHLNTVVPAEGRGTTEAFLVVRNNDRQYLELRLPRGAAIRAVSVDGRSETPRRGDDDTVRIPMLTNLRKDQAFLVALVYDHEIGRDGTLFREVAVDSPRPLKVTSDLLTWRVYVPKGRTYTSFRGDVERIDAQGSWALSLLLDATRRMGRAPAGRSLDLSRMVEDLEKGSPFNVQGDGQAFLFSNRTGTGTVRITSADPTAFLFLKIVLLVLAFAATRLWTRASVRRGRGRVLPVAAPAVLLLALLVPAGPGAAETWTAMLVGVLVSGLVSFLGWAFRRERPVPASPPPTPAVPEGGAL
jgi:hypothetical protein